MRIAQSILLLFLITVSLDAAYLRTIRVGSFALETEAQEALVKLEKFMGTQPNIVKLQKEHGFEYKYRKSGQYYITIIEPLMQRETLQEVLDSVRINYPDVYVTKLSQSEEKKYATNTQDEIKQPELIVKKTEVPIILQNEISEIKIKEQNLTVENKQEVLQAYKEDNTDKNNENSSVPKEVQKKSNHTKTEVLHDDWTSEYILEILLIVSFLINVLFLRFLFVYKKGIESFASKEMIYQAKFDSLELEIINKEKLVYQVSHELRAPTSAIIGLSHIILNTELNKYQSDNLKRIESSSEYLLSILNDILDMSKIQAGELRLENLEFNINEVLENALNTIAIDAKNKKIDISMLIDENVPSHIIGDSLRLRQILINLLGNGVKFTKQGGVSLKIRKVASNLDSVKLEFIITDTGIGMNSSQIENLFKSFTQADVSISREYGGTGLGLAISKQLIDMMKGEIRVESKKESGTSFIFSLMFKIKDADNKRQYRLPSAALMKKRVLLVEPENERAITIKKMLAYFQYNTHIIPSFEKTAMDSSIFFDIIIIDELSISRYAIDKIEELKTKHKIKTVLLSELYSTMNSNLIQDLDIDAYLYRPFTQQSMLNMIIDLYEMKSLDVLNKKNIDKDNLKQLSGKKILIAEDNQINQKVIAGLLEESGIELFFVENGQEVVEFLKQDNLVDLILMDINMPIMNGHETSKEIRKNKDYDGIPILALTADVMDKSIKDTMISGMQGHISKPIIVDLFYRKLLDILSQDMKKNETVNIQSAKMTQESRIEFEEISLSVGLERCNNDIDFYKSLLQDFKKMYKDSPKQLNIMCTEEKFKEARSAAMDIKDVALNIGAYNLCESAAALEYEFEKGTRGQCNKLVDFYEENLIKLFKDIDKYLEKLR